MLDRKPRTLYYPFLLVADVAQLVEHTVVARVVESSILFIRPIQEKTPRTLYEAFFFAF